MNYRLFGKSGLRVSELCLGTMTFGTEWGWGADKGESKKIFDTYAEAGGNFLDTANRYTEGTSERFLGEFIKSERHHFVLATKFTLRDQPGDPNFAGNHRKNMMRSVEESLRRLDTEFIDLLWVHAWDGMTPLDELLRALPRPLWRVLVLGGLVLPALLAVWAARQRKAGWPTALWALEIAVLYVFFSSLLGDGYVEIQRHAVLCYSLGCLSLTALFGAAMHHAVPAPSPNQPSGFVP